MKKIVVVALERKATEKYVENLEWFFAGMVEVEGISIKDDSTSRAEADVFLISNQTILNIAKKYMPVNSQVEYVDISFYREDIRALEKVPPGTRALLVDYREYMAISLAALLNEFGIQQIDFIPYAPGMKLEDIDKIGLAITPGLPEFVPAGIDTVMDIGYRKIDIATINSLAVKLGIDDARMNEKMIEYAEDLCHRSQGITGILKNLKADKFQIEAILESIDDGIMITGASTVLHCNRYICRLVGKKAGPFDGCVAEMHPFCRSLTASACVENQVFRLSDAIAQKDLVVSKRVFQVHDNAESAIVIIKDAEKIQTMEIGIRKSLLGKGYVAKYTFDDVVYTSEVMRDVIERARKIAMIDATTLIFGDTGTGKELFAQAIHNSSIRKKKPFVAINCAAISDSLLESELFGYEEGAFTGAKKGGKKGLFELAHGGTIFLDELGCISQMMQVKLLRVLQEKEVMRIGGVTLVPVNVRVIAATNDNLESLVAKGVFRKDLYYRINNFAITLPALKDRREDIPVIIESIMEEYHAVNCIEKDLMSFLMDYEWGGNVRELRNCMEYLVFMGQHLLNLDDLPSYMRSFVGSSVPPGRDRLGELFGDEKEVARKILEVATVRNIGRRGLQRIIEESGYEISEYRIRWIINYLREKNLVCYGRGREGIHVENKALN